MLKSRLYLDTGAVTLFEVATLLIAQGCSRLNGTLYLSVLYALCAHGELSNYAQIIKLFGQLEYLAD